MNTAQTVKAILNKDDKAVDHILLQNKAFSVKIDELKDELRTVRAEKDEMEEENDSITKSKNILQGYMKNIHEMNKVEKKLKTNYHTLYKNYFYMYYILVFHTIMFYMLALNIEKPMIQFASYVTLVSTLIGVSHHHHKFETITKKENSALIEELNHLHKATDMVSDLLDSL